MYISNFGINTIVVYDKNADGSYTYNQSGNFSKGLMGPNMITFDPNGNAYVADLNTSAVAVLTKIKKASMFSILKNLW